jgi:hypothetical protein
VSKPVYAQAVEIIFGKIQLKSAVDAAGRLFRAEFGQFEKYGWPHKDKKPTGL